MGLFGFGKKSDKNTPVLSVDEVRQRLLSLNRETAPYQIVDGVSQKVDLIDKSLPYLHEIRYYKTSSARQG